jgi:hypothetical protein
MKKCTKCGIEKLLNEFACRTKSRDGHSVACKICMKLYHREYWKGDSRRRKKLKDNWRLARENTHKQVADLLKNSACVQCSESKFLTLQFDHIDTSLKEFDISTAITKGRPWHIIKAEIEKCQILCANCHSIKSMHQNNSWRIKFIDD